MNEADYSMTDAAFNSSNGRYLSDASLLVKFFLHPKLNPNKSAAEGRPIYEELDYISIMTPGNKDSILMRPATAEDKLRFAEHFKKYKAREDQEALEGTPLAQWPGVTRGQVEELKFFNIRTLEQLVGAPDSATNRIMGIQYLRQKAEAYLEAAVDNATAEALEAANRTIESLTARLDALEAAAEADED